MNRKIEEMLRSFGRFDKSGWDTYLVDCEVANYSSINATTKLSLFFLNYEIYPRNFHLDTLFTDNLAETQFLCDSFCSDLSKICKIR